jgi:hypothetical protein
MRTLSILALVLLSIVALGAIPLATSTCSSSGAGAELDCMGNSMGELFWLFVDGFLGSVLVLIAFVWGVVRAIRSSQWGWLVGLCVGVLVPAPVLITLSTLVHDNALLAVLPISAGFLLTPSPPLVYSFVPPGARPSSNTANRAGGKPPAPRAGEASGLSAAEARDGNPLTTTLEPRTSTIVDRAGDAPYSSTQETTP